MNHFKIEFGRVTGSSAEAFADHLTLLADLLHDDESVENVSIGADLEAGRVEFEVSVRGDVTAQVAASIAVGAVVKALRGAGGKLEDSFFPEVDPFVGMTAKPGAERWRQRRIELVDA